MKNIIFKTQIFLFSVFSLVFISCQTVGKKDSSSYAVKYVPLEDNHAGITVEGSIPVFLDESLSDFNELISDYNSQIVLECISVVEKSWNDYVEEASQYKDYPFVFEPKAFYYILEPRVTEGNDFVSVVFYQFNYTGGAHGALWSNTFTWDVAKNEIATIYDVTGYSKKKISQICQQKIREEMYGEFDDEDYKNNYLDWVKDATDEESVDWIKFYVDGNSVFVRFDPYEAGPWAMGECIIQIK